MHGAGKHTLVKQAGVAVMWALRAPEAGMRGAWHAAGSSREHSCHTCSHHARHGSPCGACWRMLDQVQHLRRQTAVECELCEFN